MRISDWSSDVCSSDLQPGLQLQKLEIVINLPCKLMITRTFEELVYLRDRQRRRRSLGRGRVDGRSHGSIALHRRRRRRDHRPRRDATLFEQLREFARIGDRKSGGKGKRVADRVVLGG